jgi:hypothetical protein
VTGDKADRPRDEVMLMRRRELVDASANCSAALATTLSR